MKFQGCVIKEQGVTFAIVIVKEHIIDNRKEAEKIIVGFQPVFSRMPVILMAQDSRGAPSYFGRKDIVKLMSKIPLHAVPWKEYNLS